jgi:single-strand selective monofunctional uracil DNA glycosylase
MDLHAITDSLLDALHPLHFAPPVTHVYNPLEYARKPHDQYLSLYASGPKEIVLLGMNPGPWGMAQTGVPFGEVKFVREWLRIEAPVSVPPAVHPKRPVLGFSCPRSEVSGKRLWGWARRTFDAPDRFFARFFVVNYCPLLFIESSGRNRTPNNLRVADRKPLFEVCDRALLKTIQWIRPSYVVGVGRFAGERARIVLSGLGLNIGHVTHPSPANPKANRGWGSLLETELRAMGITI